MKNAPADVRLAYVAALKLLGRRELSEAQVRQRLVRAGFSTDAVTDAVHALRAERAIDDERVARAAARTEAVVKRRGRLRVVRYIESLGIDAGVARRAADEVFGELDPDESLRQAIERRYKGRRPTGDKQVAQAFRYLVGQGYEPERVLKILKSRQ